jgi:hypothetical protein
MKRIKYLGIGTVDVKITQKESKIFLQIFWENSSIKIRKIANVRSKMNK